MSKNKRKSREPRLGGGWADRHFAQILTAPSIIIIVGVMVIPIAYSLILSFSNLDLSDQSLSFAGVSNYQSIFTNQTFLMSMGMTVLFTGITVFVELAIGICIALVLNNEFKGRGFVRGLMILPWALPGVVNAIMWKWIFNANYGPFNALLMQLGIIDEYQVWLAQPVSAFFCVVIADVWKETPYVVLLTIAALANISRDMYEAAQIDGANPWKSFWRITLPLIKPVVLVLLITKTIWALQQYDLIYIMTGGGPVNTTQFITLLVQRTAIKYHEFGTGAAMSYVLTIVCFVLTYLYIKLFMKDEVNTPDTDKLSAKAMRRAHREGRAVA